MEADSFLRLAVRAYPLAAGKSPHKPKRWQWRRPDGVLVIDTETRTDTTQALMFGGYRFYDQGACVEEGLFFGDLSDEQHAILNEYVASRQAEVETRTSSRRLRLLSLREFMDRVFFRLAYKGRALVIGFNLPFDLSRLALEATAARDRNAGGFSFGMWTWEGHEGVERLNGFRPRVVIKHIDSKRSLMGFVAPHQVDSVDRIPIDSRTGVSDPRFAFRGHFLDLKTLAYALTDCGHSLESACAQFGVEHGKTKALVHGILTPDYIDYNRRDVLATWELAGKLLAEYDTHPVALQVTKAFSPASIGKAYLRGMGIDPILEREPDFPARWLGNAQSAFFGGRTSAHIRKTVVPVVYTDFLSMYPTVNALLGLWRFVTAERVRIVEGCAKEITDLLRHLTVEELFKPATWRELSGFVRLIPDGDALPARAQYGAAHDWQIGLNRLHASDPNPDGALWYGLPDVVASVLLTGRIPKIVDAFRIIPEGTASGLRPIKLAGRALIDPAKKDFFVAAIEERKRVDARTDWPEPERERVSKALKVFANAASYGIYAEMHREESNDAVNVECHGIDSTPFTCRVSHPEVPGEYCFPPMASLITSAARLMLALLESEVTKRGGTYAMEDTDSMAIVATETGGFVACPGGPHSTADGEEAIKALSWADVAAISDKFSSLNPYDQRVVSGSVLKIEGENYDPETERQRQLYCFAISAKRYALFTLDGKGRPTLAKASEHGLGHLLNPTDPEEQDRKWIPRVWLNIVRRALGQKTRPLPFEHLPAIGRITISRPPVMKPLARLNLDKRYAQQLKPFNFLLTCHVRAFGHPHGADAERFHLIAPYESNPTRWPSMEWIDQYSGEVYRITTEGHHGGGGVARVKTYGDVFEEYESHPESKCADAEGRPADRHTFGLMQRRSVHIAGLKYIGKESSFLEEVESGVMHASEAVYTEYPDPRRDQWNTVRAVLWKIPLDAFEKLTGKSRRRLIDARHGRRTPQAETRALLEEVARKLGLIR